MSDIDLLQKGNRWYRKWWGITLSIVVCFLLIVLPFLIYNIFTVYKQIKTGVFVDPLIFERAAPYKISELIDNMSAWTGNKDSRIVIVEFGDYNCHYTKEAYPIMKEFIKKYGDRVKFYWRNLPVIQESSLDFARGAVCANNQGLFWPFHEQMFEFGGEELKRSDMMNIARAVGLDMVKFSSCLDNNLTMAQIRRDFYAAKYGASSGTPTFFINGYKFQGVLPMEAWDQIVQRVGNLYGDN